MRIQGFLRWWFDDDKGTTRAADRQYEQRPGHRDQHRMLPESALLIGIKGAFGSCTKTPTATPSPSTAYQTSEPPPGSRRVPDGYGSQPDPQPAACPITQPSVKRTRPRPARMSGYREHSESASDQDVPRLLASTFRKQLPLPEPRHVSSPPAGTVKRARADLTQEASGRWRAVRSTTQIIVVIS